VLPIKTTTYGLSPSTRSASMRATGPQCIHDKDDENEKLSPHVRSSVWFDLDLLTSHQDDHQVVCGVS
jgi:hypothetical protein